MCVVCDVCVIRFASELSDLSAVCVLEGGYVREVGVLAKNKKRAQRMWGTRTPHKGCGEQKPHSIGCA